MNTASFVLSAKPVALFLTAGLLAIGAFVHFKAEEQKTPIVREVEAAGSGDVAYANVKGLTQWLSGGHQTLALKLAPQCITIANHVPDAHWNGSQEGRVCRAVIPVASYAILASDPFQATN